MFPCPSISQFVKPRNKTQLCFVSVMFNSLYFVPEHMKSYRPSVCFAVFVHRTNAILFSHFIIRSMLPAAKIQSYFPSVFITLYWKKQLHVSKYISTWEKHICISPQSNSLNVVVGKIKIYFLSDWILLRGMRLYFPNSISYYFVTDNI